MTITIYHNPNCGNSRKALELIRERGVRPVVVEYMKTPLGRDALKALIARLGLPVRPGQPDQALPEYSARRKPRLTQSKQQQRPENRRNPRQMNLAWFTDIRMPEQIKIHHRTGRKRVECGT